MGNQLTKEEVLESPRVAYEQMAGQKLDDSVEVVVLEDSTDVYHFVLPSEELGEKELASTSGGVLPVLLGIAVSSAIVGAFSGIDKGLSTMSDKKAAKIVAENHALKDLHALKDQDFKNLKTALQQQGFTG